MEVYQENAPVGVPNVAGVLSIPSTTEVIKGFPNNVLVQHVSGNQGVIVKTIELSGESANDFVLTFTGNTPLLIGKGSSLEVNIEYIGNEKIAQAQLDLNFSGKDFIRANIVGRLTAEEIVAPSEAPSQQPSNKPSGVPSLRPTHSTPPSEKSSPPPTSKPNLRPSQSPPAPPATTNALPTEFADLIINAGASDEDMTKVSTATTWTYKVFPFIQISNTDVPIFYRSHRSAPSLTYKIDRLEPERVYDLSLGFAEIYRENCQPGARIMDIRVNEVIVRKNLDVFLESGCEVAHLEQFSVIASSEGQLTITIGASVENAMLSLLKVTSSLDPSDQEVPTNVATNLPPSKAPLDPPSNQPSLSVSLFSALVIDAGSQTEDASLISGNTWTYGIPNSISIAETDMPAIFRTHRSGPKFSYILKDLHPSEKYDLALGFAEIWHDNCSVGKRVMIISVNGNIVKDNLDVFVEAGCESAYTEVFSTEAQKDGSIEVTFEAAVENAMISYISLAKAPTWSTTPSQGPALRPSSQPSFSHTPEEIVIDAGAANEDVTAVSANTWTFVAPVDTEIKGTTIPSMFRTHRSAPMFFYTLKGLLPSGSYHIELGFAETWYKNCDIGKRLMSIGINNNVVNPVLDVYKEVGCNKAYSETYTAKATNSGELLISFNNIVENAMVSLIKVKRI